MDTAKIKIGVKSDLKLARALDMTGISRWCDPHKPVIPEISVMLILADLCDISADIALLDRAEMEAYNKAPEAVPVYQKIKEKLKSLPKYAAALFVAVNLSFVSIDFDGGGMAFAGEKIVSNGPTNLYYGKILRPINAKTGTIKLEVLLR